MNFSTLCIISSIFIIPLICVSIYLLRASNAKALFKQDALNRKNERLIKAESRREKAETRRRKLEARRENRKILRENRKARRENKKNTKRFKLLIPIILVIAILCALGYLLWERHQDVVAEAQEASYNAGYNKGNEKGYDEGYNDGYDTGADDGYEKGYYRGHAEGFAEGYSKGKDIGYDNGYSYGYQQGLSSTRKSYSNTNDITITVYITDTGSKYHRSNCSYLWSSSHAINLNAAKAQGYEPCSRCCPPT